MTTTACLPECERNCWTGQDKHAFGCPVAAMFGAAEQAYFGPRAPQAEDGGKVEAIWDNTTICFGNDCPNCERERKNKLAPEPKPGSEEMIPEEALHIAAQCWCDPETSDRVMDPPLATAFARRLVPYLALRAELAAAREETIRSNGLVAIERASRERAEARVRGLEAAGNRVVKHRNRHYRDVRDSVDMLERVLATRKEGEIRG